MRILFFSDFLQFSEEVLYFYHSITRLRTPSFNRFYRSETGKQKQKLKKSRLNRVNTGCCKSPIRFEKRVYLPKPAENLVFEGKTCQNELKTWFLLDRLVYEGMDKICKPFWFETT
jgi:hypothetical protein